jgi:hypothetical protein
MITPALLRAETERWREECVPSLVQQGLIGSWQAWHDNRPLSAKLDVWSFEGRCQSDILKEYPLRYYQAHKDSDPAVDKCRTAGQIQMATLGRQYLTVFHFQLVTAWQSQDH